MHAKISKVTNKSEDVMISKQAGEKIGWEEDSIQKRKERRRDRSRA